MAETEELKNGEQRSHSPDEEQHSQQTLDEHPDSRFPPGFPPFYGYPPDGSGGDGGSPSNGIPQFFPFPPGAAPPGLYQPFGANMPGGPLFPIPIGQLTGVGAFKSKRLQVKNACVNCAQACKKCDNQRPCERCKKYGITDSCVDSARKERKKGIKRGPYKRRLKSGATVTQEQDGQDADWHPSHDAPTTVDPSILPSTSAGGNPSFGGPEGYYSYPYPYPLPPPGEGGSQNGEPSAFPPHFFPYPHWQPSFGMIGAGDETGPPDGSGANGAGPGGDGTGGGVGGSARTSAGGKKKKSGGSGGGKRSSDSKGTGTKRSGMSAKSSKSSKRSKIDSNTGGLGHTEDLTLMDITSVTDPNLLGDELSALDPQVANA